MNNLFENLQLMKESDEDKIINVKLIDVEVLGDDDDYDAWDEHLNELANEYNITIEANGERSVLISGTKENIEEFLWNEYFLYFDSNHVVAIDTLKEANNSTSHSYNGKEYWTKEDMENLLSMLASKINNISYSDRIKLMPEFRKHDHRGISFMPSYTRGLKLSKYPTNIYDLVQDKYELHLNDEDDLWDIIEDLISLNDYMDDINIDDLLVPEKKQTTKPTIEVKSINDLIKKYNFKSQDLYIFSTTYNESNKKYYAIDDSYYGWSDDCLNKDNPIKGFVRNGGINALLKDKNINVININEYYNRIGSGKINIWKFNNSNLNDYILLEDRRTASMATHTYIYLIPYNDFVKYFDKKFDNETITKISNNEYEDIADKLQMFNSGITGSFKIKNKTIKFRSLYSRPKMSYGQSFAYNDIFKLANKEITTKFKDCVGKIYNKIWQYVNDENLILVSLPGFHFLTTKDMLFEDLETNKNILLDENLQTMEEAENKTKEVYIKSDNNFYIVYDKTNDAELFRALKTGGNHGQTIEDLLKQFNLKLVKEVNE